MSDQIEPDPATVHMDPSLGMLALGVSPQEEILLPSLVVAVQLWSVDMGFAAIGKFALVAQATVRAGNPHHVSVQSRLPQLHR